MADKHSPTYEPPLRDILAETNLSVKAYMADLRGNFKHTVGKACGREAITSFFLTAGKLSGAPYMITALTLREPNVFRPSLDRLANHEYYTPARHLGHALGIAAGLASIALQSVWYFGGSPEVVAPATGSEAESVGLFSAGEGPLSLLVGANLLFAGLHIYNRLASNARTRIIERQNVSDAKEELADVVQASVEEPSEARTSREHAIPFKN